MSDDQTYGPCVTFRIRERNRRSPSYVAGNVLTFDQGPDGEPIVIVDRYVEDGGRWVRDPSSQVHCDNVFSLYVVPDADEAPVTSREVLWRVVTVRSEHEVVGDRIAFCRASSPRARTVAIDRSGSETWKRLLVDVISIRPMVVLPTTGEVRPVTERAAEPTEEDPVVDDAPPADAPEPEATDARGNPLRAWNAWPSMQSILNNVKPVSITASRVISGNDVLTFSRDEKADGTRSTIVAIIPATCVVRLAE